MNANTLIEIIENLSDPEKSDAFLEVVPEALQRFSLPNFGVV